MTEQANYLSVRKDMNNYGPWFILVHGVFWFVVFWGLSFYYKLNSMRFFARLVAICNLCFIVTVVMRYIENDTANKTGAELTKLPFIQNTLVVLGYSAIIMNFIFLLVFFYLLLTKRLVRVPRFLLIFNLVVLAWQIIFHFDLF